MAITPFKVIQGHQFGTNWKPICDFLLVINSNLPPILHRFQFMVKLLSLVMQLSVLLLFCEHDMSIAYISLFISESFH